MIVVACVYKTLLAIQLDFPKTKLIRNKTVWCVKYFLRTDPESGSAQENTKPISLKLNCVLKIDATALDWGREPM